MPTGEDMLATIDRAYAVRCAGDKAGLAPFFAPGATFDFNGADSVLADMRLRNADAAPAIGALIDRFTFHSAERGDSFVADAKAAVRMRVNVSTPGGEPVDTEFFDVWTFDEAGRVANIAQFADTAMVAAQVRASG